MKLLTPALVLAAVQAIPLVEDADIMNLFLSELESKEGETANTAALYSTYSSIMDEVFVNLDFNQVTTA
jgi:hypothetical protein